jgi:hypothetical protein
MSTPYSSVFSAFLSKITDPMYTELEQTDVENQLVLILNNSLIFFKYPKIDIFDKNDDTKVFNKTLNYDEVQIISNLMVLQWIEQQINSLELLRQKFTDREFKLTSQAEHLKNLISLRESTEKKCAKLMREYSIRTNRTPNFSYLASDDV